jgi:hypothetical protein
MTWRVGRYRTNVKEDGSSHSRNTNRQYRPSTSIAWLRTNFIPREIDLRRSFGGTTYTTRSHPFLWPPKPNCNPAARLQDRPALTLPIHSVTQEHTIYLECKYVVWQWSSRTGAAAFTLGGGETNYCHLTNTRQGSTCPRTDSSWVGAQWVSCVLSWCHGGKGEYQILC